MPINTALVEVPNVQKQNEIQKMPRKKKEVALSDDAVAGDEVHASSGPHVHDAECEVSVSCEDGSVRVFSHRVHGDSFAELAAEFAGKNSRRKVL